MSFTQLHPTIPMVTPKGKGYAIGVVDYSTEHDLCWVVAQDSGEIWMFRTPEVRMQSNITMGRHPKPQHLADKIAELRNKPSPLPVGVLEQFHKAADDAHFFGSGFVHFTKHIDGSVTATCIDHESVSLKVPDAELCHACRLTRKQLNGAVCKTPACPFADESKP
jgi:hypothetical protein